MAYSSCLIGLFLVFHISKATLANNLDEVTDLPGLQNPINFKQYSGYLNASDGKHLHYWFVESQHNPAKDPVVLWMNGGPGCSSMEGFLNELGPFHVNNDGKTLRMNEFSWNMIANVLFLEAPAGVGFSYSDSGSYSTNDDITAKDNYLALQDFFTKYPQFQTNDFYITGESYGGIYVPTLSVLVLNGLSKINFKGFAVGNGYLDAYRLGNSIIFFAYHHGLIDDVKWQLLTNSCCNGVPSRASCHFNTPPNQQCAKLVEEASSIIYDSGLNMYNLYDTCAGSTSISGITRDVIDKRNLRSQFPFLKSKNFKVDPPCVDPSALENYLNREEVRSALHIPTSVPTWVICSGSINYTRIYNSMKDQVMQLIQNGIKGLVYNGDVDMACNFLGDEWFVEDLGLPVVEDYRPWKFNKQIAGFVKTFKKLTFVTIKGSGHMVPQDKPGPSFKMISSFLYNKPY